METETVTIESRNDFAQWAIERAQAIVAAQGGNLAIASRNMDEQAIASSGNALGTAIAEALLEVFDVLMPEGNE